MAEEKHRDKMTKLFHGWLKRLVDKAGKPALNDKGLLKGVAARNARTKRALKGVD